MYEVEEDQKVKLASLEFLDYVMQWRHQIVMDIALNKKVESKVFEENNFKKYS